MKLLPCPFCGEKPTFKFNNLGEVVLVCEGDECVVKVCTFGVSKSSAAKKWNERKEKVQR